MSVFLGGPEHGFPTPILWVWAGRDVAHVDTLCEDEEGRMWIHRHYYHRIDWRFEDGMMLTAFAHWTLLHDVDELNRIGWPVMSRLRK